MVTSLKSLARQALVGTAMALCALSVSAGDREGDGRWRKIDQLGAVMGADGKMHEATCSGLPGTDPSFSFWAKKGSSKNLMVFFEGGGACWDNFSCSFPLVPNVPAGVPQFFVPALSPATNPANFEGLFKSTQRGNPVRDWSIVYIPYCTGDLHTGSATKTYQNGGNPFLPVQSFAIQHRGFDNFMVVLDWMKKNLDKPKTLLVTGVSAGGYGATANFPWIARTYPHAKLNVLADGSQGVTSKSFDSGPLGRNSWNPQLAPWVFGNNPSNIPGPELLRVAAKSYPKARLAQFTTALDEVQITFYGYIKAAYGPAGSCPNPAIDWYQQMSQTIVSYGQTLPNYRYYVAGGSYHTIISSPGLYTEGSAGVSFQDWLDDMLDDEGRGDRPRRNGDWRNSACPTCLISLPCQ
jgi:Pectinacetylesterase